MDPERIEALITPKTKMLLHIASAGLSCEIDKIMEIANRYNLIVMQDCAQSYGSVYKGCLLYTSYDGVAGGVSRPGKHQSAHGDARPLFPGPRLL